MINTINYALPILGLGICLFVIFTHRIDTRCPIRIAKMCLWISVWALIFYYDHPRPHEPALTIMIARLLLIAINALYIIEACIYIPVRKKRFKQEYKNKVRERLARIKNRKLHKSER